MKRDNCFTFCQFLGSEMSSLALSYLVHEHFQYMLIFFPCLAKERWDSWLLPLRLPHSNANFEDLIHLHRELINDYYKSAVKYLKLALYSTPPILAALLPFIQVISIFFFILCLPITL